MKKILVVRFSSIGDIVLTSPILRCLKNQMPDAEIHFLTKLAFKPVICHNPNIDKCHYLDQDWTAMMEELKKEKFDFLVDLHHNVRTLRIKKELKIKSASFPKKNREKWLFTNFKANFMPNLSIVDRYFEAVKPLSIHNDGGGLDYFIGKQELITNEDLPTSHIHGYVACVIGGSYFTKKFPVEKWLAFAAVCPYPIVLLGSMDDREAGQKIAAFDPIKIYNSCGKFKLNESADLIQRARVVVSNDTGLMHIAAAFQKPIISLWGNTVPALGMFPYYGGNDLKNRISPLSTLMVHQKLSCQPCSKLGYEKCPRKHFKCMNELSIAEISTAVKKYWK